MYIYISRVCASFVGFLLTHHLKARRRHFPSTSTSSGKRGRTRRHTRIVRTWFRFAAGLRALFLAISERERNQRKSCVTALPAAACGRRRRRLHRRRLRRRIARIVRREPRPPSLHGRAPRGQPSSAQEHGTHHGVVRQTRLKIRLKSKTENLNPREVE